MSKNIIHITDNCAKGIFVDDMTDVKNLSYILNKPIRQLIEEDDLLIFPHSLLDADDKIGDQTIGALTPIDGKYKVQTGNIMGFVGKSETQLHISSRFGSEKDDFFLYYMLCQVHHINVFDMPYSQGNIAALDLLILLFPYYLSNALQQGLYKEYRTFHHNDSNVRGVIDFNRHIQKNTPFQGNVAYHERVRSVDNALMHLIRHTIEYISKHPMGQALLQSDIDTRTYVAQIQNATPSYSPTARAKVISENLRPKVHPYYSEYRPLQQLCMQILRQEEVSLGENNEHTYGILFDGAWLWEEYLASVLIKVGFVHPQNKLSKGYISLFTDNSGQRYPDFYHAKSKIVLDAKYKTLEHADKVSRIDRDDIHQVISYMHVLSSNMGGVVFPSSIESSTSPIQSTLKGHGGTISLFSMHIPTADNWDDFIRQIKDIEFNLIQKFVQDYLNEEQKTNANLSKK